jgi:hypothetical protein
VNPRPERLLTDEELKIAARNILQLRTTGIWPNAEWPRWVYDLTFDIPEDMKMDVAINRIEREVLVRFSDWDGSVVVLKKGGA